jgi:hypothetical protein
LEVKGGSSTLSLILVVDLNDDSPQSPFFFGGAAKDGNFPHLGGPWWDLPSGNLSTQGFSGKVLVLIPLWLNMLNMLPSGYLT